MSLADLTREAARQAIAEFDRLGRDSVLSATRKEFGDEVVIAVGLGLAYQTLWGRSNCNDTWPARYRDRRRVGELATH